MDYNLKNNFTQKKKKVKRVSPRRAKTPATDLFARISPLQFWTCPANKDHLLSKHYSTPRTSGRSWGNQSGGSLLSALRSSRWPLKEWVKWSRWLINEQLLPDLLSSKGAGKCCASFFPTADPLWPISPTQVLMLMTQTPTSGTHHTCFQSAGQFAQKRIWLSEQYLNFTIIQINSNHSNKNNN